MNFSSFAIEHIENLINYNSPIDEKISLDLYIYDIKSLTLAELDRLDKMVEQANESLEDISPDDICSLVQSLPLLLEKDAQLGILKDSSQELYAYYVIYKLDPVPKDSLVSMFIDDPTTLDNTYYLYDVYVNPKYRGLGMGKLFLGHITEWYEKVYLHVRETNPAIHLYKNLGFVFIDRVIDYYSVDCTNALALLYIAD